MRLKDLLTFMVERHNICRRKRRGEPKPWTDDEILQRYRFCNIYRELDTVTQWIAENWRRPHSADPDLWFAMVVARLINQSDSLSALGYPVPWRPERFMRVLESRPDGKVFNAAYKVGTGGTPMPKIDYLNERVLTPMWVDRKSLRRITRGTLAQACCALMEYCGMAGFMAGQVIADLKYVKPLRGARDWWTWAVSGPGSRRGLNRVLGRDRDTHWGEEEWLMRLRSLHADVRPLIRAAKIPMMHAQDLQNSLCEFDKYERTRLGEGKPKQRYDGV